ncbi:MAG: hypothetical protein JNM00_12975, partial [Flavobacteriales bacterium]|nr:hypothetical protein [Flavobacteriales bacterium]
MSRAACQGKGNFSFAGRKMIWPFSYSRNSHHPLWVRYTNVVLLAVWMLVGVGLTPVGAHAAEGCTSGSAGVSNHGHERPLSVLTVEEGESPSDFEEDEEDSDAEGTLTMAFVG